MIPTIRAAVAALFLIAAVAVPPAAAFEQSPGVPEDLLRHVEQPWQENFNPELPLAFTLTATVSTPAHTFDMGKDGPLVTEAASGTYTDHLRYDRSRPWQWIAIPGHDERAPKFNETWRTDFVMQVRHARRGEAARSFGTDAPLLVFEGSGDIGQTRGIPFADAFNWTLVESDDVIWSNDLYPPELRDPKSRRDFAVSWERLQDGITLVLTRTDAQGDTWSGTIELRGELAPWQRGAD